MAAGSKTVFLHTHGQPEYVLMPKLLREHAYRANSLPVMPVEKPPWQPPAAMAYATAASIEVFHTNDYQPLAGS